MVYNIIPSLGSKDKFQFINKNNEVTLKLPIYDSDTKKCFHSNFWKVIDHNHVKINDLETDLYRLAVCVYLTDLMISREKSYDCWTRDINLIMPVSDIDRWNNIKPVLIKLLSFLSGDIWKVSFRECKITRPEIDNKEWKKGHEIRSDVTTLFSGGLDSFIGAVDSISGNNSVSLVGHYGDGATSIKQEAVSKEIMKEFSSKKIYFSKFGLSPIYEDDTDRESTQRTRSFLFLTLGIIMASSNKNDLVVPENGFISLNVPLSVSRLGSCSTRTTHPYIIDLFQEMIDVLGVNQRLITPYRFMTKGEMLLRSKNKNFISEYSKVTMSCAHPTLGRRKRGGNPNQHCGYCVPCIIRRAAMFKAGLDAVDDYRVDVLKEMSKSAAEKRDLKAFLIILNRKNNYISAVQQSGPLIEDIDNYVKVYKNGLDEVREFLSNRKY